MAFVNLRSIALVALSSLTPLISALGQKKIISFESGSGNYQIAGGQVGTGQILVSSDDYWGVIRAAGDLALDFGRVTGTTYTLSNGANGSEPASYTFAPVDVSNNTVYRVDDEQSFTGPNYTDPRPGSTVVIAGTVGHSKFIDDLIAAQKLNTSQIDGKWESFVSQLVETPIPGCPRALVIAGSDPRGTIYGIYDISEQIGVSPWYFWADVPPKKATEIYALPEGKVQGPPSVKYRGFFLNDEQPGLSSWVSSQWNDTWNGAAGYNHHFYSLVGELLLRLRANYLWPTVWGSMVYVDDPFNQPLLDAYEVVLGGSHTEPMMRAQNEFGTFYKGQWAYNLNNKTIDEYFRYGVQRAKPYSRNSLWTMAMRGTGDTAIEGNLGTEAIVEMLEVLVQNQQRIIAEGLGIKSAAEVPSLWCLYKEVQSYQERGLHVPEDITLLWADDNWGNVRRLPLVNETSRSGGAGVYYHFDYVGGSRDYKWINTIQLEKTAEQMSLAYARDARRIWIVNVGDLKPLEVPISHFFDLAYDTEKWGVDGTGDWLNSWATREFGESLSSEITDILTKYGMYAARRKFELVQPQTYSVINYNEADAVLEQWAALRKQAQTVYDALDEEYRAAFFEMILHPITGGEILHKIQVNGAKNQLYAGQKRNLANRVIDESRGLLDADAELTNRWNELLDGKWVHMLDQTHLGYDDYWQQPMRNTLPDMRYVQTQFPSLGGQMGVGAEASNASVQGDDQWHSNSGNDLTVPPLDPYGALTRYFEVFTRGNKECPWEASPSQPWVKLSQYKGTVGGDNGTDSRVFISIDWENAPAAPNATMVPINVTTACVGKEKYSGSGQKVIVPVVNRKVPSNFTEGFVESDGHVSIEGPHYQKIIEASSSGSNNSSSSGGKLKYHVLKNYGRTLGGVTLYPPESEKVKLGEGPALEYNMYLFSNTSKATVTVYISPSGNYLGDGNPLEYGISLYPTGGEQPQPKTVQPVGKTQGQNMPLGWDGAVADAVWGLSGNYTKTAFNVAQEGAYTLRIWALLPNIIVQKIVVDLGGVRKSYLGPPESFLLGRDEQGAAQRTSFADTPGIVGGKAE
ncbi:immunoglobulin I-set domain-containing protein [Colletotrichum falcatum]|nr:immunoglobulin I-set domain-containing protein [Colletotrichum falcatum]